MPAAGEDGGCGLAGQKVRARILPVLAMAKTDVFLYLLAALLGISAGILNVTVGRCAADRAVCARVNPGARIRAAAAGLAVDPDRGRVCAAAAADRLFIFGLEAVSGADLGIWIGLCDRDGGVLLRGTGAAGCG